MATWISASGRWCGTAISTSSPSSPSASTRWFRAVSLPEKRDTITLTELADLPIIQFHSATVMAQLIAEAAKSKDVALNVRYQCIQGQTMVALAEAGLGATLLTESVARTVRSDAVQSMLIVDPPINQQFGIVRRRGQMLSPAAARLVELIRSMTLRSRRFAPRPRPCARPTKERRRLRSV